MKCVVHNLENLCTSWTHWAHSEGELCRWVIRYQIPGSDLLSRPTKPSSVSELVADWCGKDKILTRSSASHRQSFFFLFSVCPARSRARFSGAFFPDPRNSRVDTSASGLPLGRFPGTSNLRPFFRMLSFFPHRTRSSHRERVSRTLSAVGATSLQWHHVEERST